MQALFQAEHTISFLCPFPFSLPPFFPLLFLLIFFPSLPSLILPPSPACNVWEFWLLYILVSVPGWWRGQLLFHCSSRCVVVLPPSSCELPPPSSCKPQTAPSPWSCLCQTFYHSNGKETETHIFMTVVPHCRPQRSPFYSFLWMRCSRCWIYRLGSWTTCPFLSACFTGATFSRLFQVSCARLACFFFF